MNNKQKIDLWTGIIVIALMGLIPPSAVEWEGNTGDIVYHSLLDLPKGV